MLLYISPPLLLHVFHVCLYVSSDNKAYLVICQHLQLTQHIYSGNVSCRTEHKAMKYRPGQIIKLIAILSYPHNMKVWCLGRYFHTPCRWKNERYTKNLQCNTCFGLACVRIKPIYSISLLCFSTFFTMQFINHILTIDIRHIAGKRMKKKITYALIVKFPHKIFLTAMHINHNIYRGSRCFPVNNLLSYLDSREGNVSASRTNWVAAK